MKAKAIEHEEVIRYLKRQEMGDAELLAGMFEGQIIYDIDETKWYLWDGHHWKYDKSEQIYNLIGNEVADRYYKALGSERDNDNVATSLFNRMNLLRKKNYVNNVLDWAQKQPGLFFDNGIWDRNPYLLGCSNCIVNLKNGQPRPGEPNNYIRTIIPTPFLGLDQKCTRFELFWLGIFNCDTKRIRFMQRLLGYGITGLSTEHVLPVLSGQGRNGKDTLVQILESALGLEIAGPTASEILLGGMKNPGAATPYLYDLRFKRLAYVNETNDGAHLNAGQVKWLTGGSTLTGRPLHGNPITFNPQHLLLLITNSRPQAPADDYALWKRVFSIEFGISFVDNPLTPNEKKIDKNLSIALKEELPGILAWLIKGCLMWQEEGLNPPESVIVATEEYRKGEDTIGQFLEDQMEIGTGKKIKSSLLYQYYKEWIIDNGGKPLGSKRFIKKITPLRFDKERYRDGWYILGLEPKSIEVDVFAEFN